MKPYRGGTAAALEWCCVRTDPDPSLSRPPPPVAHRAAALRFAGRRAREFLARKVPGRRVAGAHEDIDPPQVAGASDDILRTLGRSGSSGRRDRINAGAPRRTAALDRLQAGGALYGCACTRKEIADSASPASKDRVSGTCRAGPPGAAPGAARAHRRRSSIQRSLAGRHPPRPRNRIWRLRGAPRRRCSYHWR